MLLIFVMNNKLGLYDTYFALILPYIAGRLSFNTLLFVGFCGLSLENWRTRL
jgi:ABC-type glycerol-3-phosphate transport system permease component